MSHLLNEVEPKARREIVRVDIRELLLWIGSDNAINEKCSRIKAAFLDLMDEYQADYYIINSHVKRHQGTFTKIWFERLKIVNLPRELVVNRFAL